MSEYKLLWVASARSSPAGSTSKLLITPSTTMLEALVPISMLELTPFKLAATSSRPVVQLATAPVVAPKRKNSENKKC